MHLLFPCIARGGGGGGDHLVGPKFAILHSHWIVYCYNYNEIYGLKLNSRISFQVNRTGLLWLVLEGAICLADSFEFTKC